VSGNRTEFGEEAIKVMKKAELASGVRSGRAKIPHRYYKKVARAGRLLRLEAGLMPIGSVGQGRLGVPRRFGVGRLNGLARGRFLAAAEGLSRLTRLDLADSAG
jgi:hypothetical protein